MLKSLVFACLSLVGVVQGYSGGATSCVAVGHGTFKTPLPTDWTLSLHDAGGNSVTTWTAGQTYTAQISGTTTFKGWQWGPLKGTPASFSAGASTMAGTFTAGDSLSHSVTGCPGSITQTSASSHTSIKALWTPPAAGTGTVSLWSVMVISKNGNNYNAVMTVNEAPVVAGNSPTPAAAISSPTHTETATATATKSSGASGSDTGTQTRSPSSGTTVPATAVANTGSGSGSGSGVTVVTSGTNAYNLLAVGLGCTFGGAFAVALVVVALRRSQPKKIFNQPPTVMHVSPLQEAIPIPNPYV